MVIESTPPDDPDREKLSIQRLPTSDLSDPESLQRAVRYLMDRAEIMDVEYRWSSYQDHHDWDGLGGIFTDDVELHFPTGVHTGPDAVVTALKELLTRQPGLRHRHVVWNHHLSIDGDRAHVYSVGAVFVSLSDAGGAARSGIAVGPYDRDFRRTSEGWKMCRVTAGAEWADDNGGALVADMFEANATLGSLSAS